ncbi:Abi family protein [Campylobacter sp. MIT 21-1685]|uniref:Abi family protein n=1 Tax=unclassified Campylobacter TaxID=2593542 RepID=UPI00224B6B0F|nr:MULTISPECIES: Abi family protein [unclassified Campylobacter]MCX2683415.1 Abi family protein [Campylobacter sp. MIT 21-1684]MCX2751658.1 Abi family protein [Campylobacter sp. MIT 21-1682]MCX2807859.1 Abi family protein [Campylobacter sp. MIT 21-1685]
MINKPKLTIGEQVNYLENLGIKFNIFPKQKAIDFLTYNNYFFKIKSYAKNYEKYNGKYINLDFAYLVEFSTLDMHLRRFILNLSLDVEHLLKVSLNAHFCKNKSENGYDIVKKFLADNENIGKQIGDKANNISFINHLAQKYQNNFALWNLVEILSFGEFLKFYKFYFDTYPNKECQYFYSLAYCVRILRNASAHNNCILNTIQHPYNPKFKPNKNLQGELAKNKHIPTSTREKLCFNPALHDFIALIMLFNKLCISKNMQKAKRKEFVCVLRRFRKNKDYFTKNNFIISQYLAFEKIGFRLFFQHFVS